MDNYQTRQTRKCRHFRAVLYKTCEAGIHYAQLGGVPRLPCLGYSGDGVAHCEDYEPFTPEEQAQKAQRNAEFSEYIDLAMAVVRVTEGDGGEIQCPRCNGQLQWSRADNGHTWGHCLSGKCIGWKQ